MVMAIFYNDVKVWLRLDLENYRTDPVPLYILRETKEVWIPPQYCPLPAVRSPYQFYLTRHFYIYQSQLMRDWERRAGLEWDLVGDAPVIDTSIGRP